MKEKPKAKQTGKPKAKRAETTRGEQTAQGANPSAANGGAKHCRPVWVHESDAEEIEDFSKPSPRLFTSACAFIWDMAETAYRNGDNDLLSRKGIADALEFIAGCGVCIGEKDAGDYAYMLKDWKDRIQERKAITAAFYEGLNETERKLYRVQFWLLFDETEKPDKETHDKRIAFLGDSASMGGLLRTVKSVYRDNPKTANFEMFEKMTDAIIRGRGQCKDIKPARVRADWLNSCFEMAGESLARWFDIAALPDYKTIAETREMIAENFGVFPAPFTYNDFGRVKLKTDLLEKLIYISRATAHKSNNEAQANPQQGANLPEPVGASEPKAETGAAQIQGAEIIAGEIRGLAKVVQAAKPNPPEPKKKNAGRCGGMSQANFAALLKHYGGKKHGEAYTARTVKDWEHGKTEAPTAGGVKYCAELRRDILKARTWAHDFNMESENAYKARKARV